MKRRNVLASMGAFTASGSLVLGSGAFTSAEVQRDVDIDIVGDPDAFLGLLYPDANGNAQRNGIDIADGGTDLFFATNQFGSDTEITSFSAEIPDESCLSLDYEDDLPSPFTTGVGVQVQITEDCGGDCPEKTTVEITAEGDGFSVEAERAFEISSCPQAGGDTGCTIITKDGNDIDVETDVDDFEVESSGNGNNETWTLSGGVHNCIKVDVEGNHEITLTDVCVQNDLTIADTGTPNLTIEHSSISGELDVDISGDASVNLLESVCVGDDVIGNVTGNASLSVGDETVEEITGSLEQSPLGDLVGDCDPC